VPRYLDQASLKHHAPYLRWAAVQPGDVLLTRSIGLRANLITTVTKGQYSHAAIFVPTSFEGSAGSVALLEADGFGVGFTLPKHFHFCTESGTTTAYSIPHSPERFKLLRHPEISALPRKRLQEAAQRLFQHMLHRPYSKLQRLVKPAALPDPIERLAEEVLAIADRFRAPKEVDGIFCSELVALYFRELALQLFTDERAPPSTFPSHLDDIESCLLREVEPNAFLDVTTFRGQALIPEVDLQCYERDELLPMLVAHRVRADATRAKVDNFHRNVVSVYCGQLEATERSFRQLYESATQHALEAAGYGDYTYSKKFRSHAASLLFFAQISRELLEMLKYISNFPGVPPDGGSFVEVLVTLTNTLSVLSARVLPRYERSNALFSLNLNRSMRHAPQCDHQKRKELEKARRALIDQWQRARESNREDSDPGNIVNSQQPSEDAMLMVRSLLQRAGSAAAAELGLGGS